MRVAAPGKVILHGEHAVVYGKKAIAASVGLYTYLDIQPHPSVHIKFADVGINSDFTINQLKELKESVGDSYKYDVLTTQEEIPITDNLTTILGQFIEKNTELFGCAEELKSAQIAAFEAFLFLFITIFDEIEPMSFSIETELPVGAGLGSSASFAVALAGGLLIAANRTSATSPDLHLINKWAYVSEKFVHGSPSGVDNSVATFGGAVVFRKGSPFEKVQCSDIEAIIVNTKVPRSTKDLVRKVAELKMSQPEMFEKLMDEVEEIVEKAEEMIKKGGSTCPDLVEKNQIILAQLGVSHPELDLVLSLGQNVGASGKLTGAGGGGCAFILKENITKEKLAILRKDLSLNTFQYWETGLCTKGFHVISN